jgi:RHS repeat-associated protein
VTKHYYAAGQRLATRVDGELYYILGDHLGSTTVVVDENGDEVGHVVYDPYGEVLTSTLPADVTDRLFTGQRWESTIGLYDYRARFYDPSIGQFTQPDSLVAEPGNPIAWNRYAYVYNAPVHYTDSSGHFIDTLWDIVDLGADALNCLGDSDTLACYMLVPDALALAVPFVPGVADNVVKAGRVDRAAQLEREFQHTTRLLPAPNLEQDVLQELYLGTEFSSKVARQVEEGHITVHLLNQEDFVNAYRNIEGVPPLPWLYGFRPHGTADVYIDVSHHLVLRNPGAIAATVVHEGAHVFHRRPGATVLARELRAYFQEARFAIARGIPNQAAQIWGAGGQAALEEAIKTVRRNWWEVIWKP